jgi:hypothetical protein
MIRFRTIAAGAVAALMGMAVVTGPATAAEVKSTTPESFIGDAVGDAVGRALNLEVLGTKLTLGQALANVKLDKTLTDVNKTLSAVAQGAGNLAVLSSIVDSSADLGKQSDVKAESCAQALPVAGLLELDIACGLSLSKIVNGLPIASSEGRVAGLDLSANTVLSGLLGDLNLQERLAPVTDTVATVTDLLSSTLQGVGLPAVDLTTTLDDLINSILNTKTLEVEIGKSVSSVIGEATKLTSTSSANGAVIRVLPTPELLNGTILDKPLITITVGGSSATAVLNRTTGKATPSVNASLVKVELNQLLQTLGLPAVIDIAPGQDITLLEGTPLESTIKIGAGSTTTKADGTALAIADGVSLQLLKGLAGGIKLELAHSEASLKGAPEVVVLNEVVRTVTAPVELPRTGNPAALPLIGGALLVVAVAARRLVLRFSH